MPQDLSHGTNFGFSCRKTDLTERLLGFRAARLSYGTSFGVSCHKICLTEPILDFRAARLVSWHPVWIFVPPELSLGPNFEFSRHTTGLLEPILHSLAYIP